MSEPHTAGFIGLGSMGAPIARRLARCGFKVTGCDKSPAMLAAFDEPGTKATDDPAEAATGAGLLGICVRTDEQLESLLADGRVAEALGPGGLVILHSTIAPDLARSLAARLGEQGIGLIDVGVSGGGPAAIEGQLSLFVGGARDDVMRAMPWLEAIGKSIAHLGPVGRGLEGKLLNNLISIANYGMSAALVDVVDGLGFERKGLLEALMAGSAQSFALRVAPGFITPGPGRDTAEAFLDLHDLLRKDVEHARDLPASDSRAMAALLASCEAMLVRLRRAAAQASGGSAASDPQAAVDGYFAATRAKDIEALMALYAEDASFTLPNGKSFTSKEALRAMHGGIFASGSPFPTAIAQIAGAEGIAVEIEAALPDGSVRHTTNHFRFDETGKIRSVGVYWRS